MVALRDYQSAAIEALREHIRAGVKRLLLVSGTGTGKTVIAAAIIAKTIEGATIAEQNSARS